MMSEQSLPLNQLPSVSPRNGFDLLDGVVVVDLTTSIAGPYATLLLADFGADVIKIERPGGGDDARGWGPPFLHGESLWFISVNRNKRSVTLDVTQAQGYQVLCDLVKRADVVVSNQPRNVQRKLRTDFDSLKAINPALIFASITGFGLSGARADHTCYDLIAEGYSGIMDITGAADGAPQKIGAPAADMLAGQDAAMAVMAALVGQRRNKTARLIDISLVESMIRFLQCRAVPYLGSGEVPQRSGGTDSVIAIYQAFDTADEPLTLGLGSDGIWRRFWKAVGQPDYAGHADFGSNAARRRHRKRIVDDIQAILLTAPRRHWLEVFAQARVPAGPINRIDEMTADTDLLQRGLIYALNEAERVVPQIGLGIQIDGETAAAHRLPPRLGEHTEALLRERLGYSDERIDALRALRII